jgi:rhodanese-related sulfurtransferase
MTQPVEPPVLRLARLSFDGSVRRDAAGTPLVTPEFVAEQGQYVRIVDVREFDELLGALGHIPAVTSVPMREIAHIPEVLPPDTLLVLVSGSGRRAAVAAHYLETLGMRRVAALEGGMEDWKKLGFSTPRDAASIRRELRRLPPGIGRDGRPLHPVEHGSHLSEQQILDHVGEPGAVRWVKLAAFLLHGKRSCVDGRDDKGVIGTPGGDAGELLLALSAAEAVRGAPLTDAEVERILLDHLDTFGRFYLHSDTHAMNRLIVDGLRKDPRIVPHLGSIFEPAEWRAFHASPPDAVRDALLEHLVEPKNMGCGHLRFALTDPAYGVRDGLSRALLRAFHRARWAGAPEIEWVVLGGDHVEGAVIEVVLRSELHSYTRIPLVSPQVDGLQMFVSHPEVTAHLRRETASFLVEAGVVSIADEGRLLDEIRARGDRQLGETLGRLAAGLPIFRLHFPTAGRDVPTGGRTAPTIERMGTVGGTPAVPQRIVQP